MLTSNLIFITLNWRDACTSDLITYRAKLVNADWFRQRAFFLNFPSMEGKITGSWLAERQNLLAPDWLSAPLLHLVGFFEKFCLEFSNARSLQILPFMPTYSVEKHGNQAIAWREFKKGQPKASHRTASDYLCSKLKLWSVQAPLCVWRNSLVVVKFPDFRLFTTASYKSEVLQAKENSTDFPQTDG